MSKTCLFCGTKLSETAKFCKGCGKDVTVPAEVNQDIEENLTEKLCTNCGAPLSPTAKFCKNCGYQMSQTDASLQLKDISSEKGVEAVARQTGEKGIGAVARQAVETVMASSTPGDCFLGVGIPSIIPADTAAQISATISVLSPFKVLGDGLITAFKGIKTLGKDKKALGGAIAMAVIWFILTMLSASGADIPAWLNFLTFAKGGTTGGIIGFVGGVLGKGLFASLIVGIMHDIRQPKPAKNLLDSTEKAQSSHEYGLILCGMGLALILYNFMTGDNSLQNSMAGIVAAASVVRSSKQSGFIRQLMVSLTARFAGKKLPLESQVKHLTTGFAAGFGLSLPLSFSGGSWICYLVGILACIVGIILCSTARKQKDVSAV